MYEAGFVDIFCVKITLSSSEKRNRDTGWDIFSYNDSDAYVKKKENLSEL